MTTDSPVATRFVAAPDHWSREGAGIRAIVCHMAEGGGTVSWLTRNDGNSSHYVVEYTGRVTQMVRESRAAGSMNPKLTRTDNDTPFTFEGERVTYGRTALTRAGIAADPNRYAVAIEVEGYAKNGPNLKQRVALARLVDDIRRRHGVLPVLGHRDQQDYKACPGHHFPWFDYGGHAVKRGAIEDVMKSYSTPKVPTICTVTAGAWLYDNSALQPSAGNVQINPGRAMTYLGQPTSTTRIVEYVDAVGTHTGKAMFVKTTDVENIRLMPDGTPFAQVAVDTAFNAGVETAAAAVAKVPRRIIP